MTHGSPLKSLNVHGPWRENQENAWKTVKMGVQPTHINTSLKSPYNSGGFIIDPNSIVILTLIDPGVFANFQKI